MILVSAVDQRADLGAEQRVDLAARGAGVLDGVVQQRGGDGGVVEPHLGEDRGDFERMGEDRGARGPLLIAVRLHGVDIGAVEQRLVGVRARSSSPARPAHSARVVMTRLRHGACTGGPPRQSGCLHLRGRLGSKLDQRERGPALEPSDGAWLAILRNSSSSVILSIALSVD